MKSPQIIKKNYEFDRVYRRGHSKSGNWLNLSAVPRQKRGPRFGVAVSRKVRGAVRRNRVKRVLREVLRRHLPELRGDIWLILLGRQEMPAGCFAAVEKEFLRLAEKSGLLRRVKAVEAPQAGGNVADLSEARASLPDGAGEDQESEQP